jgi:AbrB family looped-hinge helix DNA binding protein
MRITSKGQVTIPQHIREAAGLEPHTEVDFLLDADGSVRLVKSRREEERAAERQARIRAWLEDVRKIPKTHLTTDEIMAMTRGEE